MNPLPEDMPGLSKQRLLAFEAQRRAADEAVAARRKEASRASKKGRAADTLGDPAAGAVAGGAPKRKRGRRNSGAGAAEANKGGEERIDWAFSEDTIEAYYEMVSRVITPRAIAQEARREGNPVARPRDYHG